MAIAGKPFECAICGMHIKYDVELNVFMTKHHNWNICDICKKRIEKVFLFLENELGLVIKYSWKYSPDD